MQPQLERVEVEASSGRDHDLAVEHAARGQLLEQHLVKLGKVAVERLQIAALDEHVGGAAEHDRAKAVPLGLVQERALGRQLGRELRQHRLHGRGDRVI